MHTISISDSTYKSLKAKSRTLELPARSVAELILASALGAQPFQGLSADIDPAKAPTRAKAPLDSDTKRVLDKISGITSITSAELSGKCKGDQMRDCLVMRSLGWTQVRFMRNGDRRRLWLRPGYRIENGEAVPIDADAAV